MHLISMDGCLAPASHSFTICLVILWIWIWALDNCLIFALLPDIVVVHESGLEFLNTRLLPCVITHIMKLLSS